MPGPDPRAAIVGLAGPELSAEEARLFRRLPPFGAILFARNVVEPAQVAALVAAFRAALGRAGAPVLVDQEGGRVVRLRPPHWRHPPPAARFGALYARDPRAARRAAFLNARLIAEDLRALGVTVCCAPVLDLPAEGADPVIGDRAFASDPRVTASLGRAVIRGLQAGGVIPVMKHIPGHGRARVDSHLALPVVEAPAEELLAHDARPFAALAGEGGWAMTAHILYTAWDDRLPATLSARVLRVIRRRLGFGGPLVSDDLAMRALRGPPGELALAAISAGCDAVLECSGEGARTEAVLAATPPVSRASAARFAASARCAMPCAGFSRARAEAALAALIA